MGSDDEVEFVGSTTPGSALVSGNFTTSQNNISCSLIIVKHCDVISAPKI